MKTYQLILLILFICILGFGIHYYLNVGVFYENLIILILFSGIVYFVGKTGIKLFAIMNAPPDNKDDYVKKKVFLRVVNNLKTDIKRLQDSGGKRENK